MLEVVGVGGGGVVDVERFLGDEGGDIFITFGGSGGRLVGGRHGGDDGVCCFGEDGQHVRMEAVVEVVVPN